MNNSAITSSWRLITSGNPASIELALRIARSNVRAFVEGWVRLSGCGARVFENAFGVWECYHPGDGTMAPGLFIVPDAGFIDWLLRWHDGWFPGTWLSPISGSVEYRKIDRWDGLGPVVESVAIDGTVDGISTYHCWWRFV